MFWIWLAAVVVFLILELMTPTLIFACFVAGALVTGVFSYFFPEAHLWQIGIFAAVSLILLPLTRTLAKRITKPAPQQSNVDALLNKVGLVTKTIDPNVGGQVRIEGEIWIATADEQIEQNQKVKIIRISGTKLHVQKT